MAACTEKLRSLLPVEVAWKSITATVCLWIAFLICNTAFSLMSPFFPREAIASGASQSIIGVIIGISSLAVVVLSPLLGYLLPRVGISTYILIGLLLVGTSYILMGFVTAIPWTWGFIVACISLRVAEGAGTAMFYTATFSTFPKFFPKSVSLLMSIFQAAAGLGFVLGRPLGGFLYQIGGYRLPFISVGVSALLFSFPCTFLVTKIRAERVKKFLSWTIIFSVTTDLFFILLAFAIVAAYIALANQGPVLQPFLYDKFLLGPVAVSWIFFIEASSFSISNLFAGLISNKLTSVYVSVVGLVVTAFGEFLMGIQDYIGIWKVWIVCVSLVITGGGAPFAFIPIYAKLITVAERYIICETDDKAALTSYISGIVSASVCFGQFISPILGGVLSDFLSFPIASVILGEIILAEALLLTGAHLIDKCTYTQRKTQQDS